MSRDDWITVCCVLVVVSAAIMGLIFLGKILPG